MKQYKIVNAYKQMELLADIKDLSEKEQWDLYQLRKTLKSHYEFQGEREQAIREKFNDFADDNGDIHDQHAKDFLNDLSELNNMEIDIKFIKPQIRLVKGISFKTAEELEDFIEFTPG